MTVTGSLLVAGTTSDAGKSVVTAGICRALARRGVRVAPFKAQNMSNNSMVCADGAEIGRAQWVQALAARVEPEASMNPVLLKPGSDRRSHVIVMGEPAGAISSYEFAGGRKRLAEAAFSAYDGLRRRFDVVVCEGAGSPAEINLRSGDYINMGLARHGGIPTVVVGDIDRGGVFAAMYGTVALLEPADQRLIAGFVINKFRGDLGLLEPGLRTLEKLSGRRVFGVLPWRPDLWLDSEDALDLEGRRSTQRAALRVAVVRFPRISNFTDIDALGSEPDVDVVFAGNARALQGADVIVLPGTRATLADLRWLRERGMDEVVLSHARSGRPVLGICGGFQMLGRTITDPENVEGVSPSPSSSSSSSGIAGVSVVSGASGVPGGSGGSRIAGASGIAGVPGGSGAVVGSGGSGGSGAAVDGLGLLDVDTVFSPQKVLRLPRGEAMGHPVGGYEIHHGRVTPADGCEEFLGGARDGQIYGTMWHGSLESDGFRRAWLSEVATAVGHTNFTPGTEDFAHLRERRLDLLGDLIEHHLDLDKLLQHIAEGVPSGLPLLEPGASR